MVPPETLPVATPSLKPLQLTLEVAVAVALTAAGCDMNIASVSVQPFASVYGYGISSCR